MANAYGWQYYEEGEVINDANLKIIKYVYRGRIQPETRYLVEMLCCGSRVEMHHAQIANRIRKRRQYEEDYVRCRLCKVNAKGQKNRHTVSRGEQERRTNTSFLEGPMWPRPSLRPPKSWSRNWA